MFVYIRIYVYQYDFANIQHTNTHVYTHTYIHIHIHICMYVFIYICTYVCTYMWGMYTNKHMFVYICRVSIPTNTSTEK